MGYPVGPPSNGSVSGPVPAGPSRQRQDEIDDGCTRCPSQGRGVAAGQSPSPSPRYQTPAAQNTDPTMASRQVRGQNSPIPMANWMLAKAALKSTG